MIQVNNGTEVLSVNDAAEIAGVTVGRIRQLLISEEILGWKLNGRAWVVDKKSLMKYTKNVSSTGRPRSGSQ